MLIKKKIIWRKIFKFISKILSFYYLIVHANQFIIQVVLQSFLCISLYKKEERESFFPGLADNFQIKIIGLEVKFIITRFCNDIEILKKKNEKKEQRLLYEDEFNIVITLDQLEYDNSKFIKTLPPLLLPCTKCQSEGIIESYTEVISRSNTEYLKSKYFPTKF